MMVIKLIKKIIILIMVIVLCNLVIANMTEENSTSIKITFEDVNHISGLNFTFPNLDFWCKTQYLRVYNDSDNNCTEDDRQDFINQTITREVEKINYKNTPVDETEDLVYRPEGLLKKIVVFVNKIKKIVFSNRNRIKDLELAMCNLNQTDFCSITYYCQIKDLYQDCPFGISGGIGTRCYKTNETNTWHYCSGGWVI